ncbi:MAG TPA: diacylglycerol kinase family protein [Chitinophagaceae bacterium]|nr:diacylglycerol kinase family protein [Chitinophagaceae bacterium]
MNRKILYFINPVSGPKRRATLEQQIIEKTQEQNISFEILFTNTNGDYPFLIDKIKKDRVTDVVICGGDGTVNQLASLLHNADINFGIIPIGSGNGLALAAKIPRNINKALQIIFTSKPKLIDAFLINNKFSCMLCGVGFDAQVAHDFAQQEKRGLLTYVQQSVKNFIKAEPYLFDITHDGKTFSTEAYFISVANSNQFGNNFTIAPQASLNDGLLDVIIVKKMSKARMIWAVLKQIRSGEVGKQEESPDSYRDHKKELLYFQTDKLVIHNHQLAPLHIDGEPAETSKQFRIEVLPKAFKLIMP